MVPVITVRLTVTSNDALNMDVVTERTGVSPDSTWTKGSTRMSPSGHRYPDPYGHSGWQLTLGPERTLDLPGLLLRLLAKIEPGAESLAGAVAELDLQVSASAHVRAADETPEGTLSPDLVARLAALHAAFDLDLYVVEGDYEPV